MASGLLKGGVDLDTLFMARVNAARAAVNIKVGGTDIANRYEQIGAGTKIADVNWKSGGTDISNFFRNISQALGPTLTLSQSSYTVTGATAGNTFTPNLSVTTSGGTPTAWNWVFPTTGPGVGVWSINSGQGTASCAVRVGSVAGGQFANCTCACDVTVGGIVYRSPSCSLSYDHP